MNTSDFMLLCAFGTMILILFFSTTYIYFFVKNKGPMILATFSGICTVLCATLALLEKKLEIENYEMFGFFFILFMFCCIYHIYKWWKDKRKEDKT